MSRNRLAGRLEKLERLIEPRRPAARCRTCGLEHARKVTLDEMRSLMGSIATPVPPDWPRLTVGPFCLCECCAEYRSLAELTHR